MFDIGFDSLSTTGQTIIITAATAKTMTTTTTTQCDQDASQGNFKT
jgi:hypothetical protein